MKIPNTKIVSLCLLIIVWIFCQIILFHLKILSKSTTRSNEYENFRADLDDDDILPKGSPLPINHLSKDALKNGDVSLFNKAAAINYLKKKIQPGNHTNVPAPETRIGPNGERGYVHCPKFLQKKKRSFHIPKEYRGSICLPAGKGDELPEGAFNLNRIRKYIETSRENRNVKLFCAIYTHSNAVHQTDAISETWGPRCDGLLYAGNESSIETGHMHLPCNSRKKFGYKGLVQRTRSILAYLYDNFLNDYDFFHLSGDDTYLIVENLKEFLASEKVQEWDEKPDQYLMAGYWMHWGDMKDGYFYLGGGSGYTLSRKALKAYVEGPLQTCKHAFKDYSSKEDLIFTDCARDLTTKFIDTRDSLGAHRYHQLPVQRHSTFPHENRTWGYSMRLINQTLVHMNRQFGFPLVYNTDYISESSVAFHKHSASELRRLELLLYKDGVTECGDAFVEVEDAQIKQER
jgi:hypothetical protein